MNELFLVVIDESKGKIVLDGVHRMNAYHRAGVEPVTYQVKREKT